MYDREITQSKLINEPAEKEEKKKEKKNPSH